MKRGTRFLVSRESKGLQLVLCWEVIYEVHHIIICYIICVIEIEMPELSTPQERLEVKEVELHRHVTRRKSQGSQFRKENGHLI